MISWRSKSGFVIRRLAFVRRLYSLLAPRAYSAIMFGALFCTMLVKFYHSWRYGLVNEYAGWVLADISFLLGLEVIMALVCFGWPRRWALRTATIIAAIICTWSVMNSGWLLRTGTQILPRVLLPLFRSPINSFGIVIVNLIRMPKAAFILLGPSAIALTFFFFVLANPPQPAYKRKRFFARIVVCIFIIIGSVIFHETAASRRSPQVASLGLQYNCHLRAVMSIFSSHYGWKDKPERALPTFDQLEITRKPRQLDRSIVVVILEGIQYRYTSLSNGRNNLTPYLAALAEQGVEFSNTRTSLTHTTKALFALLSGRFPSASQDIAEAVPAVKPYASVVTVLENELNYRTAFFQSAMGDFESRPGLVYNLGFDKFWARDDLEDPNSFLGYLACDEFAMLKPITEWIKADEKPFFLTILCSVTHDPYEVPEWFDTSAKEPLERYRQSVLYTDKFLAALDVELTRLDLKDELIFCVIGDHGEAFGEHGQLGHALIAFDEALRVPFCLRAPFLVEPGLKVTEPVSSADLTPTLLELLGFETESVGFDGINTLAPIPEDRKVYFSGWMREGPVGFVQGTRKFIYNPADKTTCFYDMMTDPFEFIRKELPEQRAKRISEEIIKWRKSTIILLNQQRAGRKQLFGRWLCRWNNRVSSATYH